MNLLLVFYHPVVFDLAITFQKLGMNVEVCVKEDILGSYGTGQQIIDNNRKLYTEFSIIGQKLAIQKLYQKKYDLVGCDGVFDGDKIVMAAAKSLEISWFCINGYPYNIDEPSNNILTFSHWLPQVQYLQKYPSEGHVKNIDWKNINDRGFSEGKNILQFYPNFWKLNSFEFDGKFDTVEWVSSIQRYEECNKESYEVFCKAKALLAEAPYYLNLENVEGKSHAYWLNKLNKAYGLFHAKWSDCPGIVVLEAMLLDKPVATMRSFVNASFNQEVLIDGYSAIVADSFGELLDRMKNDVILNARHHALMLTDFDRQKSKLEKFIDKCVEK